jgi:hypothetical protein
MKTHTRFYTTTKNRLKWRTEEDSSSLSFAEDDEESLMLTAKKSLSLREMQVNGNLFSCRLKKCRRPKGSISNNYLHSLLTKCSVLPVVQIDDQFQLLVETESDDGSKREGYWYDE